MNFYNEYEKYPAQWLRNLAEAEEIPVGEVDERDIRTIKPAELTGFTQCHFFAGLGGWPYALRLAGWPENRPVWTGSCPCQPFSVAGQGKGVSDDRHLWPAFRWLIAQCRPATIFGEQVASADGREWLSGVRTDLEAMGYVVGAADYCAAGVGAPHIRQRLWWVAHRINGRSQDRWTCGDGGDKESTRRKEAVSMHNATTEKFCTDGRVGQPNSTGSQPGEQGAEAAGHRSAVEPAGGDGGVDDAMPWRHWEQVKAVRPGRESAELSSPWDDFYLIPCADGKARRVESGISPLAHGVPQRVGQLRAYGNAITPQVAAVFIKSFMDAEKF